MRLMELRTLAKDVAACLASHSQLVPNEALADQVKSMPDLSRDVLCWTSVLHFLQAGNKTNLFITMRISPANIAVKL